MWWIHNNPSERHVLANSLGCEDPTQLDLVERLLFRSGMEPPRTDSFHQVRIANYGSDNQYLILIPHWSWFSLEQKPIQGISVSNHNHKSDHYWFTFFSTVSRVLGRPNKLWLEQFNRQSLIWVMRTDVMILQNDVYPPRPRPVQCSLLLIVHLPVERRRIILCCMH